MLHRLAALLALAPALVCAAPSSSASSAPAPSARAALDRELPALMAERHVPSISVAQLRHGRVVMTAAWGEQTPGVPATPDSLYNIASLTKPLTAEIVLRAASRGKLSLDEPMYRVWTDPDIAGDPRRKLLTPRLALSHRTGFPNWRAETGLAFKSAPGTAVGYSGEGYEYVARFTEKKLGRPFEALAQTSLFGPEGMTSTAYTARPWFAGRIATPADATGQRLAPHIGKTFNAADLVYTTARDYAAFVAGVWRNDGLTPAVARERNRIQMSEKAGACGGARAAACPDDLGFGLGWQLFAFKGGMVMMHTGKDEGVFTFAYLDRRTGDGAVILTNGDMGGFTIIPILEAVGASPDFVAYLKSQMG